MIGRSIIGPIMIVRTMIGRWRWPLVALLLGLTATDAATAGQVLDHVRRHDVVRCASEARAPVAMLRGDGAIDGLAVELCRAVAIAVLGRGGRVAFTIDAAPRDADIAFVA